MMIELIFSNLNFPIAWKTKHGNLDQLKMDANPEYWGIALSGGGL